MLTERTLILMYRLGIEYRSQGWIDVVNSSDRKFLYSVPKCSGGAHPLTLTVI